MRVRRVFYYPCKIHAFRLVPFAHRIRSSKYSLYDYFENGSMYLILRYLFQSPGLFPVQKILDNQERGPRRNELEL